MKTPRILSRTETTISPWVRLVEKEVEFSSARKAEIYHALGQADYTAILAVTAAGRIAVVRQYRPAVEEFTYELPAGIVEPGEHPEETCRRELKEETGLTALSIKTIGTFLSDTGRLENRIHVFFVETSEPDPHFIPEDGLSVEYVDRAELRDRIQRGQFKHQLHLGVFTVAAIHGYWSL
jgi:8-oxo-dGTP pyrophosphatase MutT (NUDIX family)